jgi:hypothetical protein
MEGAAYFVPFLASILALIMFRIGVPNNAKMINTRKNQQIGVLKNTFSFPPDFNKAVRKFFSAIGPRINPKDCG